VASASLLGFQRRGMGEESKKDEKRYEGFEGIEESSGSELKIQSKA
jgi:hypothetical protein